VGINADAGIDREAPAMRSAGHVFGVIGIDQLTRHEGAQNALTRFLLHLFDGARIESLRRMKNTLWFIRAWIGGSVIVRHRKNPIDHTYMEVDMGVEAGTEAVDEGDRTDAGMGLAYLRCAGTMAVQMALQHAQKDA